MELTKEEREVLKMLLEKQIKELNWEEVKKDAPLDWFAAEQEYKQFLSNLLKKL
jgi:hypothetical protein